MNNVCFRMNEVDCSASIDAYEKEGGYAVLKRIIKDQQPSKEIVDELKASNLRGRGGAGFPTGLKWSFLSPDAPGQKYIICNSDESEPGTCKDRVILTANPHQVIEGIAIACYTVGATVGYHYFRGEYVEPFDICEKALKEAYDAGYLGQDIFGSGTSIEIFNVKSAGAYICGEETGLMNALEGKRAWPRYKPPFPAHYGLYGKPTNINNTETLASVPVILAKGGEWFSEMGVPKSGGTKIFSVSGHVENPGNFEVPLGTPFKDLLALAGGVWKNRKLKAVIPGGSSMPILPAAKIMDINMDYDSVMKAGSMLGSGAVVVMDETTCMVSMCARIAQFYMHESCGQCTPCREGTGWMYQILQRVLKGEANLSDLDRLGKVAKSIEGNTICAFGEAAAWPIQGFLRHFYSEFEHYVQHKKSVVC
jgi:NADH-quinone oxidoreductase subunit F